MLDTYVVSLMVMWANWRARRMDGGTGYPTKSAFVINPGSSGYWSPELDSKCYDIDRIVVILSSERKEAVMKHYTVTGTKEQKAKLCGCCVRTYDARIDMAHRDILGYLNDIAAGIALPAVDYKQDVNYFSMEV